MIGWVDHQLTLWGAGRRSLEASLQSETPLASLWAKMQRGWSIAAASSTPHQTVHGALSGDALAVHVAIQRAIEAHLLTERQYQVLCAHYIVRAPVKWKRARLNINRKNYYARLDRAHAHLSRFLTEPSYAPGDNTLTPLSDSS